MFGITDKMEKLMMAITNFEMWRAPRIDDEKSPSLSWRNKNPGNLRSSPFQAGTRDGFAYFRNDYLGLMALQWDLIQKAKGNTVTNLNGESSIDDLINVWAPPNDNNNTTAYINYVYDETGFSRDFKLRDLLN